MPAASDAAHLSSLRAQVEELAGRVEAMASGYADTADSGVAEDLYAAERALVGARRAITRAEQSLARMR